MRPPLQNLADAAEIIAIVGLTLILAPAFGVLLIHCYAEARRVGF